MFKEWNSVAEEWNRNMQNGDWFQRHIIYPEILRILLDVRGKEILDAGCGNGHLCRFLSAHGAEMLGIDNSQEMVVKCRENSTVAAFEHMDITASDLPYENRFDVVIFNNSMQDMKEYQKGLVSAYRLLKAGGHLLIVVKHPCFHGRSEACGWRVTTERGEVFTTGHGLTDLEKNERNYTADCFLMDDYLNKSEHTREWYGFKTTSYARTLAEYINAVIETGFMLCEISEPAPIPEGEAENPSLYALLKRIPNFIFMDARK